MSVIAAYIVAGKELGAQLNKTGDIYKTIMAERAIAGIFTSLKVIPTSQNGTQRTAMIFGDYDSDTIKLGYYQIEEIVKAQNGGPLPPESFPGDPYATPKFGHVTL